MNPRKGENDRRQYLMINLQERLLPDTPEVESRPSDYQSDSHPTEAGLLKVKLADNKICNISDKDRLTGLVVRHASVHADFR